MVKGIVIEGILYDFSEFKHPGGVIIELGDQETCPDATWLFKTHHAFCSKKKVESALKKLPVLKGDVKTITTSSSAPKFSYESHFIDDLVSTLKKRGFDLKVNNVANWALDDIVHLAFFLISLTACATGSFTLFLLGSLFFYSSTLSLYHTGSHGTQKITNKPKNFLLNLCWSFRDHWGANLAWWKGQHCNFHHGFPLTRFDSPEKENFDLNQMGSIGTEQCENTGWIFFAKLARNAFRRIAIFQLGRLLRCMAFSSRTCTNIFTFVLSCAVLYALETLMMEVWVFFFVYLNHFTSATDAVFNEALKIDWWKYQVEVSLNVAPRSFLMNVISAGLSNQIEHHLFPWVAPDVYPLISPIVQEVARKHGVKYESYENPFSFLKCMIGRAGSAFKQKTFEKPALKVTRASKDEIDTLSKALGLSATAQCEFSIVGSFGPLPKQLSIRLVFLKAASYALASKIGFRGKTSITVSLNHALDGWSKENFNFMSGIVGRFPDIIVEYFDEPISTSSSFTIDSPEYFSPLASLMEGVGLTTSSSHHNLLGISNGDACTFCTDVDVDVRIFEFEKVNGGLRNALSQLILVLILLLILNKKKCRVSLNASNLLPYFAIDQPVDFNSAVEHSKKHKCSISFK